MDKPTAVVDADPAASAVRQRKVKKDLAEQVPVLDDEKKKLAVPAQIQSSISAATLGREKKISLAYKAAFLIITGLSFLTRTWGIGDPGQVVFDEVHFGKFASYYLRREYYFDVHPPLGKLLLAAAGWFVGYDGHFLFDNIGDDYVANNVPYIALRSLPATCGALIAPIVFLTLKEMKLSVVGATFGAMLIVLDNSLITQSRLILLDSMLTLFAVCSVYAWVKFQKLKHIPFTPRWYLWLSLTGLGLACTTGVKMVGMLTIAAIGVAVLFDLWDLLDYRKGLSMRQFSRHFAARALCLIFLPLAIYLSFFYIHFAILIKSGPGDAFMSPAFQDGLKGSEVSTNTSAIPYYANVTIRHRDTSAYLHSHVDKYPLRYEDGRISTQGQQVTGYPHRDLNNHWTIEPVDADIYPLVDHYVPDEEEQERSVRYLRHNDLVRLKHARTSTYLITHDVASPLTPTHMEMTTFKANGTQRYNETLWRVETLDGEDGDKVRSKRGHLRFVNAVHKVAVHCHKGLLPDWGYGQQEINGNKAVTESFNVWWFDEVHHARIVNGTEIGVEDTEVKAKKSPKPGRRLSFLQKFAELQGLMVAHNSGLTKPHPYSSTPITWPFVLRGISFWERKDGLRQIYLLGNPAVWWPAITGTVMYAAMWIMDRLLLRRGIDDFGNRVRNWWDSTPGFLFLCWALHWGPFFLQGRMLFLHHYLPAFIFSVMVTTCVIEFVSLRVSETGAPERIPQPRRRSVAPRQGGVVYWIAMTLMFLVATAGFAYFAPLTYGTGFKSIEDLRSRKWLASWDLQHA
ncbi:dolichyl-phosphate-mannose---protein mannosyltransferase [Powellomyces hirtus]|uniref:Dolichyl-phosphate-mannose--protein mannosyltransferase n=1 Tax=Powellomyces hirtus TaxID=109895 RepID=A0A507DRE5_9FUNG|nr:dolichyl-phosphate-mannose---protein mannosyltransferase [Powellomyces hirtus]